MKDLSVVLSEVINEGKTKEKSNLPEDRAWREINKKFAKLGSAEDVSGVLVFTPSKSGDKDAVKKVVAWAKDPKNKKEYKIQDAEATTFQGIKAKIYFQ